MAKDGMAGHLGGVSFLLLIKGSDGYSTYTIATTHIGHLN